MIYVTVTGGNKKEARLVEQAFDFALTELMPRKKKLDVEFFIRKLEGDVDGYHEYIDRGEHNIEIQSGLPDDDLVTVVFHEMVHVRQHEQGKIGFDTSVPYFERPCEIEAYHLQEELYDKWNERLLESH